MGPIPLISSFMRIDKFLKVMQLIKRRTVANETADEGNIKVNGKNVKPSYNVKIGDNILIDMWNYSKEVQVLAVPVSNSIKKDDVAKYIQDISYNVKNN